MPGSPKKRAKRAAATKEMNARVAARARAKNPTTKSLRAEMLADLDLLPREKKWIGQRMHAWKVALEYQKQLHVEALAAQGIHSGPIWIGPQVPPPNASDPPACPE